MKYNEYPCVMPYNAPLSTTSDPEQLLTLAIAMVQKAMAESQKRLNVVVKKDLNIADLQNYVLALLNKSNFC